MTLFNQTVRYRAGYSSALCIVMAALASSFAAGAQQTNIVRPLDYSSFKLITERNIFNTRRSAQYVPSEPRESRRPARSESFALAGIMSYDGKGPYAFFEGSSSEYRKVLKPEDSIAGFKLIAVKPSLVK